ncbi:MAG: Hsp20/alpha crystallin family protein [Phycisphaeraceae bacterium]|nr:Hsp20/alpha crystallin family protein [Phycisphaeraceae bacterium]
MTACCQMTNGQTNAAATATERETRTYRPAVDVIETADSLRLVADVPGARAESIDVRVEDGVLTIRAEVPRRDVQEGVQWRLREYGVGAWERSFRLGDDVDSSRIEAACRDGVLTLTLPKAAHARPRKIEVRAN